MDSGWVLALHSPLPLHSTIRLFTPVEQDTEHFEKEQKFDGRVYSKGIMHLKK